MRQFLPCGYSDLSSSISGIQFADRDHLREGKGSAAEPKKLSYPWKSSTPDLAIETRLRVREISAMAKWQSGYAAWTSNTDGQNGVFGGLFAESLPNGFYDFRVLGAGKEIAASKVIKYSLGRYLT